ncbi:MAG: PTS sugar transporter subunit IIC/EAL domain-containing protein [Clostridia bacterium]|nr:PTS sugar transporter subunit IIC/EAL domain-containing protein [Clostridia bacterium]
MRVPRKSGVFSRLEQTTVVRAVRGGLTNIIPVLTVGAFALILKSFPVDAYQKAIAGFAGGFLPELFNIVFQATFGALSVYMTFSISWAFIKLKADDDTVKGGALVASLISFFILAGANLSSFGTDSMGPKSMFLAIITALGASYLYLVFSHLLAKRSRRLYTTGGDRDFNHMLRTLIPIAAVSLIFALFNALVIRLFSVDSFRSLVAEVFDQLFSFGHAGFIKGFLFVFISSILWFFGIHGSDILEGVMQTYFVPGLQANQAAVLVGGAPVNVLTKEFFDCFVLMGGCGATICLLIAILLFSRSRSRRRLGLTAAFPMIFNINELMVFGIPIILNPIMLIPFLLVPLVCYSTAYFAIYMGWVPMITSSVEWTTPILLGGFRSTGSIAGSILQLVNVALGVLIYLPFVRMLDRQSEEDVRRGFESFMEFYRRNEPELLGLSLIDRGDVYGDFAKNLCEELKNDLPEKVVLYYQPQYHYNGSLIGVEALLRYKHPIHGMLYPPLIFKLAEDGGFLPELEEAVLAAALRDRDKVLARFGADVKLSVNVTGTTIVSPRFIEYCRELNEKAPFDGKNICLEVTEQAALLFNGDTMRILRELRDMGMLLAIDDFSMGQTSLHYLADNLFDLVKLDGSLVRGLFTHTNTREIIASVVRLADSLEIKVLAEFVETEEQRQALHEIGCDRYQGYLYSAAVPLDRN